MSNQAARLLLINDYARDVGSKDGRLSGTYLTTDHRNRYLRTARVRAVIVGNDQSGR